MKYEINHSEIGKRLKTVRGKMTQQEFADRLEIGKASVAKI